MHRRSTYALALALLTLASPLAMVPSAQASSHREAPGITELPKVDGTDFYMFRSYEAGRGAYTTFIANYVPLQDAYGGPNYFTLDPDARYRIHIDNSGDGIEDITLQFRVEIGLKSIELPIGGKNIAIPVINAGVINEFPGSRSPVLQERETVFFDWVRGDIDRPANTTPVVNATLGSPRFPKPVDNIGQKSIPNYDAYADNFIHTFNVPGCAGQSGRLFVGQRAESFAVNLGEVFDLVNIANPVGARDAETNTIADKNITSFIVELPTACVTAPGQPVIGAWTTAALPRNRTLTTAPTFQKPTTETGPYVQVSRLGMPLVNEVVIGLKDKNKFNGSKPKDDLQFADYVTNPALPELLEILFGVQAPNNFPRTDLLAAFVTGIDGLTKFGFGEMLRLNTSIAPTAAGAQSNLGVLGGDNAGFPNGRRPGDDVVDAELRVAMGVLCHAFPGAFCVPADAGSGTLPFTDGALQDVSQFDTTFPYLRAPYAGSPAN
jgi:hypothetical protein